MGINLMEVRGITKIFPGVTALKNIDLTIEKGEIHVIVGENGAGKSTLVKILCGLYQPDAGAITFDRQPFRPKSILEAEELGVKIIFQEFNLIPFLSVAENIYFQKMPQKFGLVNFGLLFENTKELLREVGLNVSPKTPVEHLGVAQMQLVEIAKALSGESKLLIMDEPTATLTDREIARLFEIIKRLKQNGVTIIYISHRLQEVSEIGDRVTVLRDGRKVDTKPMSSITIPEIVKMMVGRDLTREYPYQENIKIGGELLKVEGLTRRGKVQAVSFMLREGEILGISGLVGSGRTEAMRAIFGADPKDSGRIFVKGREI
jgi:ribose transport system ATP-binding protein